MLEEVGHRLIDKLVGDRLFGLVLVGGVGREGGGDQHQRILHVGKGDLRLVFQVPAAGAQVTVDLGGERLPDRPFGAAAVLKEAGVVVILTELDPVGEAEGDRELDPVILLILPIAAGPLGLPVFGGGEAVFADQLLQIVRDAVLVAEDRLLRLIARFIDKLELDAGVDNRLPLDGVKEVFRRDVDIGKDLKVGPPALAGAGLVVRGGGFLHFAGKLALLKMEVILITVPEDLDVEVFRAVLGGAAAQPI